MITLYTTTNKRAEQMFTNYWKAKATVLGEIYKTFSYKKAIAIAECRGKMLNENGYDFRIISANTFQFTCGWRNKFGDIRIETKNNSYLIIDLPF